MPNPHRQRDETVLLRRVGGVNVPVYSRDPVLSTRDLYVCLTGYGIVNWVTTGGVLPFRPIPFRPMG